ncbi:fused response regulator/phosphatase [Sesbania bispinosa]|nr:fused response regulator/phosphatase [Sesbania bispinosa]
MGEGTQRMKRGRKGKGGGMLGLKEEKDWGGGPLENLPSTKICLIDKGIS